MRGVQLISMLDSEEERYWNSVL